MRKIDSTLAQHFHQITRAEMIRDVATGAENNDETIKVRVVEESG